MSGRLPDTPVFWRSSPRGVDLLAYFVPNPAHSWLGRLTSTWFMPPVGDAFPEFVAAFPLAAWLLIAIGYRAGVLPRLWIAFSGFFVALSLGPFVHLAGFDTQAIAPWAILRYVPVIGMARSPARFAIPAALGLALLSAFAIQHLFRGTARQRAIGTALLFLLAAEVTPLSRPLFSAAIPPVYQLIAAAGEERGRLLDLPTGIRDGTSSIGDFSAASQFFQTAHRRPLVGGYLSRVSEWRKRESERMPVLRALFSLSEPGGRISDDLRAEARRSRERFLARSCVRYVVVDRARASDDLVVFATQVLGLVSVQRAGDRELFVPVDPPACDAGPAPGLATRRP